MYVCDRMYVKAWQR